MYFKDLSPKTPAQAPLFYQPSLFQLLTLDESNTEATSDLVSPQNELVCFLLTYNVSRRAL